MHTLSQLEQAQLAVKDLRKQLKDESSNSAKQQQQIEHLKDEQVVLEDKSNELREQLEQLKLVLSQDEIHIQQMSEKTLALESAISQKEEEFQDLC